MKELAEELHRAAHDEISRRLGVGIVLCDAGGSVLWRSEGLDRLLPRPPAEGEPFLARLEEGGERARELESDGPEGSEASVYRLHGPDGTERWVRVLSFELTRDAARNPFGEDGCRVHYVLDVSREKRLEASFLDHLQQLASMQEIVDTLYQSVSTQEVIYLILNAVTSQMGFGFNRAFFLEARGDRLQGRIGIGPSGIEDAHRIWATLAELDLPSLRAIYDEVTRSSEPPDPATQAIAQRLEFPIESGTTGLPGAIRAGKPAILPRDGRSRTDEELSRILGTDAIAMVPVHVRGALAGVIVADNFVTRESVKEKSLNLLKTFSNYAGVALERSQLYDELRESVRKLRSANERLKSQQTKILRAEKLSAIGEMAARVSHEIRNPLVAIGGLARGLLRSSSLDGPGRDDLAVIVNEVGRLEKFLRDTLDFAKPGIGNLRHLDLRPELVEWVAAFRREAGDRGIELRVDPGQDPLFCTIDPELARRAVDNLVKNAVEALQAGDRIAVSAYREGYAVVLCVADTGPGIPQEVHSRVFEPFYTTKAEGTGLGLAIASRAVRDLGGRISLQENEKWPTIFTIRLPLQKAPEKPGARTRVPAQEEVPA